MLEWLYLIEVIGEVLPDALPEGLDPGLVGLVSGLDGASEAVDLAPLLAELAGINASLSYLSYDDLSHNGLATTLNSSLSGVSTAIDTHSLSFQVWDDETEEYIPIFPALLEELTNLEGDENILEIGGNAIYLRSKVVRV